MIVTAIVPILLTVALGFVLELRRGLDVRALSSLSLFVLLPSLIFYSLFTTEVTFREALPVIVIVLLTTLSLWLIGLSISRLRRLDRDQESFLLLTTMFVNAGNMGMPVAFYAFGQRGLDLAVIGVLVMNSLMNTVAIYYSSRHRAGRRAAIRTVFGLPAIYAAAVALLLRGPLHFTLPTFLLDPIHLLGLSTIPVAQLLLGIQLAKARDRVGAHITGVIAPNVLRLVIGPALAIAFALVFGFQGLAAKVAVLLSGMPTAVNIAIFTTEFGLLPRRTATAVFTSTIASFATISLLLLALSR